jgi:hypothetical protein
MAIIGIIILIGSSINADFSKKSWKNLSNNFHYHHFACARFFNVFTSSRWTYWFVVSIWCHPWGTYDGLQFKAPWQTVVAVNIQTQRKTYKEFYCFSKETQEDFLSMARSTFYIDSKNIKNLSKRW